jgi:hypothetical protein
MTHVLLLIKLASVMVTLQLPEARTPPPESSASLLLMLLEPFTTSVAAP